MKKRLLAIGTSVIALSALVAGCGSSASGKSTGGGNGTGNSSVANNTVASAGGSDQYSPQHPLIIKVATDTAPTHPENLGVQKFADLLKQTSGGAIKVEDFPNGQLGSQADYVKDLQNGTLQVTMVTVGTIAGYGAPELSVVELPYLIHSPQQGRNVIDSKVGTEIQQTIDSEVKGVHVLAFWDAGLRELTNNVRPVKEPSDLKGLKIRVPPASVNIDGWKALGANAAPLAFTELYMALKQGVFAGQENPPSNIYNSKFYEVQKYMSMTNHLQMIHVLMYSGSLWDTIPAKYQTMITDAAKQAGQYQWQVTQQQDSKLVDTLKQKGMKVNEVDIPAFVAKVQPLYKTYEQKYGSKATQLINDIQSVEGNQ